MSNKTIAMTEAIKFGFDMTKKYFGIIFILLLINVGFQIPGNVIQHYTGVPFDGRLNVYADADQDAAVFKSLVGEGYFSEEGWGQDRLQALDDPAALAISSEFEPDRDRIYHALQRYRYRLPFPQSVYPLLSLALWVLSMIISLGMVHVSLILSEDQRPRVADLFELAPRVGVYILAMICYFLVVLGGMVLLIIPGFIFSIKYGQFSYVVADEELGPVASVKRSGELTQGAKWQLLGFGMVLMLINLAGALCLLVGLLVTIPASMIASAHVFRQLQAQDAADLDAGQAVAVA